MKKTIIIRIMCAVLALSLCAGLSVFSLAAQSEKNSYGSIITASWSEERGCVDIAGTLTHSALVSVPEGTIGLIRILPGADEKKAIESDAPLMTTPVSVRFSFSADCSTLEERLSGYAVVIIGGGRRIVVDGPKYAGCSSRIPPNYRFKGLSGTRTADAVNNGASAAIINISPADITEGNSGYCYTLFGVNRFYDRSLTDVFDINVKSFLAARTEIYIRLDGLERYITTEDPYCGMYSLLEFLFSRASRAGASVKGIIAGRSADSLFGDPGMRDKFCTLLACIGAAVAAKSRECAVIVPLSDRTDPDGNCEFADFITYVAGYADTHTDMRISLMFECFLNPYGLNRDMYEEPEENSSGEEYTDSPGTEPATSGPVQSGTEVIGTQPGSPESDATENISQTEESAAGAFTSDAQSSDAAPDSTGSIPSQEISGIAESVTDEQTSQADEPGSAPAYTESDISGIPDITSAEPEPPPEDPFVPLPNDPKLGFYSVENLRDVLTVHSSLKKQFRCISQYWMLSWHPEADSGNALTDCFIFSYLTAQSLGASVFFTETDVIGEDEFDGLSYFFENIDTGRSQSVTDSGYESFGASSWKEIVPAGARGDYKSVTLFEQSLSDTAPEYQGKYAIWDFTHGNDILGWYPGLGCSSLKSFSDVGDGGIRATFTDRNYSDIGVICEQPEPLLKFEALGFDLMCIADDRDALIEIKIFLYSDDLRVEASTAVSAGKRKTFFINTSGLPSDTSITAVRICVRPIMGCESDSYGLELYDAGVYSSEYGSAALASIVRSARDGMKTENNQMNKKSKPVLIYSSIAVLFSALLIVGFAASDKKRKNDGNHKEKKE